MVCLQFHFNTNSPLGQTGWKKTDTRFFCSTFNLQALKGLTKKNADWWWKHLPPWQLHVSVGVPRGQSASRFLIQNKTHFEGANMKTTRWGFWLQKTSKNTSKYRPRYCWLDSRDSLSQWNLTRGLHRCKTEEIWRVSGTEWKRSEKKTENHQKKMALVQYP